VISTVEDIEKFLLFFFEEDGSLFFVVYKETFNYSQGWVLKMEKRAIYKSIPPNIRFSHKMGVGNEFTTNEEDVTKNQKRAHILLKQPKVNVHLRRKIKKKEVT
jgi:hypothetical protein